MSTHTPISQENEVLEKDIKNLQDSFNQILTSGRHYYTQEIANYIKRINNGLDNIKLEHEFQRGSRNWIKQFDPNEIKSNKISKRFQKKKQSLFSFK